MSEDELRQHILAPLGSVETHADLLTVPPDDQLLYKVISVENLLRSIVGNYLHFNRVDSYKNFPSADQHDGQQLPQDQQSNARLMFKNAPDFSAADYCDQSRARTYACCFSLDNSDHIWTAYGNGGEKGKVCVVFEFGNLRNMLNHILQPGNAALEYNGLRCHQIFAVNYGIVEYVDRENHRANTERINPILYTYRKDMKYAEEKELRVSLSAIGIGHFALKDGSTMQFLPSLQLAFNFRAAIADGTIRQILYAPGSDRDFLQTELHKLRIMPSKV